MPDRNKVMMNEMYFSSKVEPGMEASRIKKK